MSDNYNYEKGATHIDNKKVLHIDNLSGKDLESVLRGFLHNRIEDAQIVEETPTPAPDARMKVVEELLGLADRGDWAKGITAEDIKEMLKNVLGVGEAQLNGKQTVMSETLWQMLEHGRGDNRVRLTWQNLIGYFLDRRLLNAKSAPKLNMDFFGDKEGSDNINKGRNGRLSEVIPLLDEYAPKISQR